MLYMTKDRDCKGIYINEEIPNVSVILYADETVCRLQYKINVLDEYRSLWSLIVNLCKTKIVVFRRGGKIKRSEKWYFNGEKMNVVSACKYLRKIVRRRRRITFIKSKNT